MGFSVIIPSLNEFKLLPRLIGDLKRQTLKPEKVIIAEAGDLKRMRRVVSELCKGTLTVKVVKGGLPGAGRNNGAAHATGELLVFLDADARIPKDFLERAIAEFKERKLDLATVYQWPHKRKIKYLVLYGPLNPFMKLSSYTRYPLIIGTCIICTAKVFKKSKFDERIVLDEDCAFAREAVRKGARYRILRDTSMTINIRRLEKHYWKTIFQVVGITAYRLFNGEDYENRFNYEFGKH